MADSKIVLEKKYFEKRQGMKSILLVCGKCYFSFLTAFIRYLLCVVMNKSEVFYKYLIITEFTTMQAHLLMEGGILYYAIIIHLLTHLTNINEFPLCSRYHAICSI